MCGGHVEATFVYSGILYHTYTTSEDTDRYRLTVLTENCDHLRQEINIVFVSEDFPVTVRGEDSVGLVHGFPDLSEKCGDSYPRLL